MFWLWKLNSVGKRLLRGLIGSLDQASWASHLPRCQLLLNLFTLFAGLQWQCRTEWQVEPSLAGRCAPQAHAFQVGSRVSGQEYLVSSLPIGFQSGPPLMICPEHTVTRLQTGTNRILCIGIHKNFINLLIMGFSLGH